MVSANRLGHSPLALTRPTAPEVAGVQRAPVAPLPPSTSGGADPSRSSFEAPVRRPLVAGLSPQGTQQTRENDPADDTVVVIDGFDKSRTHGEQVTQVITSNSSTRGSQIRELSAYAYDDGKTPLDGRIKYSTISFLNSTSQALEEVAEQPGKVQVINQSQGSSKLDVVMDLWSPENPEAPNPSTNLEDRKALAAQLGLKPEDLQGLDEAGQAKKIFQALVDRVEKVTDGSPEVQEAKARHQRAVEQLDKQGIFYVIAAGNEGDELSLLAQKGITFSADFGHPVLAAKGDNVLVIAASQDKKRMAEFSTPSPFVFAAVDGTDIPVGNGQKADGTSFAAPQVTALIAEMRSKGFTPQQVRGVLREAARDTAAPREQEGLGIIDMKKAKKLIQQREKQWKQSPLELRLPVTVRP